MENMVGFDVVTVTITTPMHTRTFELPWADDFTKSRIYKYVETVAARAFSMDYKEYVDSACYPIHAMSEKNFRYCCKWSWDFDD